MNSELNMECDVVMLTSDSEEEIHCCWESPGKIVERPALASNNSDEELMNLVLDSPKSHHNKENSSDNDILEIEVGGGFNSAGTLHTRLRSNPSRLSDLTENPTFQYPFTAIETVPEPTCQLGLLKSTKTKQDKAKEKAWKAAEAANKKFNKPTECLKNLTTLIDSRLLDCIPNSGNILTQLQEAEMKHSIVVSLVANSVCWTKENINHYVNENAEVCSTSRTIEEDDGVVVLLAQEFTLLSQSSVCDYFNKIRKNLKKKYLTIIVYGLSAYFKEQSRKDKRRFRERVSGAAAEVSNKKGLGYANDEIFILSAADIELLKVKLMLHTECSLWPVETSEELGKILARLTKAVAERPFKEERLVQSFDFYADDVSGNIKVNKDGHGLERLWQQQLMQFPLVALETAQAIASKYQSPQALVKAYKMCSTEKDASLLLQDIPIRRHAGPLSTSRKVGPELSKKIHKFFMCKDGVAIL